MEVLGSYCAGAEQPFGPRLLPVARECDVALLELRNRDFQVLLCFGGTLGACPQGSPLQAHLCGAAWITGNPCMHPRFAKRISCDASVRILFGVQTVNVVWVLFFKVC